MNWEGGSSFGQMVRDSIDKFFTEVLFHGILFFFFIFVSVKDEQKNHSVLWRDVGRVWLVPYDRRKSMFVCRWEDVMRRGKSECQTAGKPQHKRDRQAPQEHSHSLCSM